MSFRNAVFCLLLFIVPPLSGCASLEKGPLDPDKLAQASERDDYINLAQTYTAKDDTFEVTRLGAALIVKAMHYSPELASAARLRFLDDPSFKKETGDWDSGCFLLGFFSEDFRDDDVMKTKRFRPRLVTTDGRVLDPVSLKLYGRDDKFIGDHFPVFSHWDHVVLARFKTSARPEEIQVHWPGGVQHIWFGPAK